MPIRSSYAQTIGQDRLPGRGQSNYRVGSSTGAGSVHLGPKIALGIVETIIVSLIAQMIGREAAKQLVKELLKRNPWINSLGPILWAISGAWIAYDLQGPAYRKTVPICLYLGIVALRDGEEML
ncbi:hypothetical protein C813_20290 [Kosakonia sacchari SP1]|nr:hypothetical protein C813_20290 [Kosakonia sacchari SP1]